MDDAKIVMGVEVMSIGFRHLTHLAVAIFVPLAAHGFEMPPSVSATDALGSAASSPNYQVESPVTSDGLLHMFTLATAYGTFQVSGDALMQERIRELAATAKLEGMSQSDVFLKALKQSAGAPIRFGKDLFHDPDATLKKSASGVTNMFGRIGTGLSNKRASRDTMVGSVLGFDQAKRRLAVELGVDPYTDFAPLASKLTEIASASAAGGLSVKALTMAIPGSAGLAVSSASTMDVVNSMIAEKTSAEVAVIVKQQLVALAVNPTTADRLIQNRAYTPTDLLTISQSLTDLNTNGAELFVDRAADAVTRDEAYFQRQRAFLLAKNADALAIGEFVEVAGFPLNRMADGRVLALLPLDAVAWTETVAAAFTQATSELPAEAHEPLLAITGTLTPEAAKNVGRLGWSIMKVD